VVAAHSAAMDSDRGRRPLTADPALIALQNRPTRDA
jgi:hypothetical protein